MRLDYTCLNHLSIPQQEGSHVSKFAIIHQKTNIIVFTTTHKAHDVGVAAKLSHKLDLH